MNADCATEALSEHRLAMACWTSCASLPQIADRSLGSSCVLTALSRQAGGTSANTRTAKKAMGKKSEAFMMAVVMVVKKVQFD